MYSMEYCPKGSATSLNRVRDFEIPRFHRISRFREISDFRKFQGFLGIFSRFQASCTRFQLSCRPSSKDCRIATRENKKINLLKLLISHRLLKSEALPHYRDESLAMRQKSEKSRDRLREYSRKYKNYGV